MYDFFVRIDFDSMVSKMRPNKSLAPQASFGSSRTSRRGRCRCLAGFIPIYTKGTKTLEECLDPIVRTSLVGSRCLVEDHCNSLNNTECAEDAELRMSTGNFFLAL